MSKIATYQVDHVPTLNDMVIGTDGDDYNITKNYRIGDLLGLLITASANLNDNILHWDSDNSYYTSYPAKISDASFPYFYVGEDAPNSYNRLNLDAIFYATQVATQAQSDTVMFWTALSPYNIQWKRNDSAEIDRGAVAQLTNSAFLLYANDDTNGRSIPIIIGAENAIGNFNGEHLLIDDHNQLADLNFTNIYLSQGTPLKWLALDVNRKIVYMDDPTGGGGGGVTPVSGILEWQLNKYSPYSNKIVIDPEFPYFYVSEGMELPTFESNLFLDARLYVTAIQAAPPTGVAVYAGSLDSSGLWAVGGADNPAILAQSSTSYAIKAESEAYPSFIGRSNYSVNNDFFCLQELVIETDFGTNGADGIGGYTSIFAANESSVNKEIGRIGMYFSSVTDGGERGALSIQLQSVGAIYERMHLSDLGALRLDAYGIGTFIGTPVKYLAVDADGKVIEVDWAIEDIRFTFKDIVAGTVQVYDIDVSASWKYDIKELLIETDTGSLKVSIANNTIPIASMTAQIITDTLTTVTADAGTSVIETDRITLIVSAVNYTGTPTSITGKLVSIRK